MGPGKVAAAADALCVSGNHRRDWDPHLVHVEPLIRKAEPGRKLNASLVVSNPLSRPVKQILRLEGRGQFADQSWELELAAGATMRREFVLALDPKVLAGRHALLCMGSRKGWKTARMPFWSSMLNHEMMFEKRTSRR